MSGNVPYVITGNDCDAAIPDEIREFEEACAKATRQQEAMRRENNRERRRHWREQAAREFARGPRR